MPTNLVCLKKPEKQRYVFVVSQLCVNSFNVHELVYVIYLSIHIVEHDRSVYPRYVVAREACGVLVVCVDVTLIICDTM